MVIFSILGEIRLRDGDDAVVMCLRAALAHAARVHDGPGQFAEVVA